VVFSLPQKADLMKRVFLTGASSGIGLATAYALLARGHEVWGTSRDPKRLPQLKHFHPVQLDLRRHSEIDGVFVTCVREAGHFDVLINNAGSGHFGAAEFLPIADVADQFQLLFFGPMRLMQLALAEMRPRGTGLIVNVTSLAGRLPVPFMAAYDAAKAAMSAFTMSIQIELAHSRIRIVDLQPADIRTGFNDVVIKSGYDQLYSARIAKTWDIVDRNLKEAPEPDLVARRMVKLIEQTSSAPRVTVGGLFQAVIAPLIVRFLPQRLRIWGLKRYYKI
jgi:short-subunit dehydrogenase